MWLFSIFKSVERIDLIGLLYLFVILSKVLRPLLSPFFLAKGPWSGKILRVGPDYARVVFGR